MAQAPVRTRSRSPPGRYNKNNLPDVKTWVSVKAPGKRFWKDAVPALVSKVSDEPEAHVSVLIPNLFGLKYGFKAPRYGELQGLKLSDIRPYKGHQSMQLKDALVKAVREVARDRQVVGVQDVPVPKAESDCSVENSEQDIPPVRANCVKSHAAPPMDGGSMKESSSGTVSVQHVDESLAILPKDTDFGKKFSNEVVDGQLVAAESRRDPKKGSQGQLEAEVASSNAGLAPSCLSLPELAQLRSVESFTAQSNGDASVVRQDGHPAKTTMECSNESYEQFMQPIPSSLDESPATLPMDTDVVKEMSNEATDAQRVATESVQESGDVSQGQLEVEVAISNVGLVPSCLSLPEPAQPEPVERNTAQSNIDESMQSQPVERHTTQSNIDAFFNSPPLPVSKQSSQECDECAELPNTAERHTTKANIAKLFQRVPYENEPVAHVSVPVAPTTPTASTRILTRTETPEDPERQGTKQSERLIRAEAKPARVEYTLPEITAAIARAFQSAKEDMLSRQDLAEALAKTLVGLLPKNLDEALMQLDAKNKVMCSDDLVFLV